MGASVPFDSLVEVSQVQLRTFAAVGSELDAHNENMARALSTLAETHEDLLKRFYQVVAIAAKQAEHPADAAAAWDMMVSFANDTLSTLSASFDFHNRFAGNSARRLRDLALDYKLASEQRRDASQEEAACLNENRIPAGLFPAMK